MEDMEEKIGAILNNPQMMQQIMTLAQTMSQSSQESLPNVNNVGISSPDFSMLTKIGNLAKQSSIDREQQTLLRALNPFLSHDKIAKLERAMQAAKMAGIASTLLNSGAIQQTSRR